MHKRDEERLYVAGVSVLNEASQQESSESFFQLCIVERAKLTYFCRSF